MLLADFFGWFTNYGRYNTLFHCMSEDVLWVAITVVLDVAVATGYIVIARHWWANSRGLGDSPAKRALGTIRNIFVFCGICGYLFIPVKMLWPAWRLYDIVMAFLVYFTWKYAWSSKDLRVVYNAIGRSEKLAAELAETREQARRKASFLNAVSHDLRTPLNGLMLQAEVAAMAVADRDEALLATSLAEIKASAGAAAELLNYFLELGRLDGSPEENKLAQVDVGELVDQVLRMHQIAADAAGLSLTVVGARDAVLRTDRLKVERILRNLVGNAVKFTRRGKVEVRIERCGNGNGNGNGHGNGNGDCVEIAVVDTGVGISAECQRQLFEEFFQAHNYERDRRKGFGLGLAIARRLARHLGGDIAVWSEVGVGSRFTLRLPAVAPGRCADSHGHGNGGGGKGNGNGDGNGHAAEREPGGGAVVCRG
jgi:signal transduction histidine kinase